VFGGIVGGVIGFYIFHWAVRQGFFALIVPGAMVGMIAGFGIGSRSQPFAIACGVAGLAVGLFTQWTFVNRAVTMDLMEFLMKIKDQKPLTLIMLVLGTFFSYRLALGFDQPGSRRSSEPGQEK
jgi:hypothetical protein